MGDQYPGQDLPRELHTVVGRTRFFTRTESIARVDEGDRGKVY